MGNFRGFLAQHGHPVELFWVFRDDVWFPRLSDAVVRFPVPSSNSVLAEKVYAEGRERGLISLNAIAATSDRVAATVWFPKFPEEAVQGWAEGLKLSIREPLPKARLLGGWRWQMDGVAHLTRAVFSTSQRRADYGKWNADSV